MLHRAAFKAHSEISRSWCSGSVGKTDDLSSNPGAHTLQEENQVVPISCPLISTNTPWYTDMDTHVDMDTHTQRHTRHTNTCKKLIKSKADLSKTR